MGAAIYRPAQILEQFFNHDGNKGLVFYENKALSFVLHISVANEGF
jgi:hypothetical protein